MYTRTILIHLAALAWLTNAAPLNINLGAYSPALVVGDGAISFAGAEGAEAAVAGEGAAAGGEEEAEGAAGLGEEENAEAAALAAGAAADEAGQNVADAQTTATVSYLLDTPTLFSGKPSYLLTQVPLSFHQVSRAWARNVCPMFVSKCPNLSSRASGLSFNKRAWIKALGSIGRRGFCVCKETVYVIWSC